MHVCYVLRAVCRAPALQQRADALEALDFWKCKRRVKSLNSERVWLEAEIADSLLI